MNQECKLIRPTAAYHGKQGLDYFSGISRESVGSSGLCMHLLEMPPGASAKPHYHERHDSAVYVLEGQAAMRHGAGLAQLMHVKAGDFIYIPAGVPHQPFNPTGKPVKAVIARTDPNEQESVVLLDEPALADPPLPRAG